MFVWRASEVSAPSQTSAARSQETVTSSARSAVPLPSGVTSTRKALLPSLSAAVASPEMGSAPVSLVRR
jgi:hypothetical protein